MKPYLIVCWDCHYPLGGLNNVKDSANSLEEAKEIANEMTEQWGRVHIYLHSDFSLVEDVK